MEPPRPKWNRSALLGTCITMIRNARMEHNKIFIKIIIVCRFPSIYDRAIAISLRKFVLIIRIYGFAEKGRISHLPSSSPHDIYKEENLCNKKLTLSHLQGHIKLIGIVKQNEMLTFVTLTFVGF